MAVHADTSILVSTTADDVLVNGNCTLREAVIAANTDTAVDRCPSGSNTAVDTIILPAGTYKLSVKGPGENVSRTGDLDITGDGEVTIRGAGPAATIIDGDSIGDVIVGDRVFHVQNSRTTLSGVTIRGGFCGSGGGIFSEGELSLLDSRVEDNIASEAADNCADEGYGGGGITNAFVMYISRSTITGNKVLGRNGFSDSRYAGGGLMTLFYYSEIDRTVFSNNQAAYGGAIWNVGALYLDASEITGNTARLVGGGLMNSEEAYIGGSTFSNNRGSGIASYSASTVLTSSTISGNGSATDAAGINADQALLFRIRNSTIAANGGPTGGVGIVGAERVDLANTIVAHNSGNDCASPIISSGNNLDSDGSCGLAAAGDLSDVEPLLGPLADNGGPTPTHALLVGSPAIDHILASQCGSPFDQRGVARPYPEKGGLCDIGAYEFSPPGDVRLTIEDVKDLQRAGAVTNSQQLVLLDVLKRAEVAAARGYFPAACSAINDFAAAVREYRNQGSLSAYAAAVLLDDADRVRGLVCV
jgi:CSLREA domain-containing protein